jgi:hypothetical protein
MKDLTPFKINTSKKSCRSRIALIVNDFKPTRINTSAISPSKPPRINTSKKHGGAGPDTLLAHQLLRFLVGERFAAQAGLGPNK